MTYTSIAKFVGATLLAMPLVSGAAAQDIFAQRDISNVQIKAQKLSDGLHVLFGAGGNIGVFPTTGLLSVLRIRVREFLTRIRNGSSIPLSSWSN